MVAHSEGRVLDPWLANWKGMTALFALAGGCPLDRRFPCDRSSHSWDSPGHNQHSAADLLRTPNRDSRLLERFLFQNE